MKEEAANDSLLRQFILGKVEEDVRERMEGLFLTDDVMRERILAAEQDLVEDYLEGSLTPEEKERFLLRYARTPEQQRKLRITRSIKDWAITEAAEGSAPEVDLEQSARDGRIDGSGNADDARELGSRLSGWKTIRTRPAFLIPIAAVIVLAIVLGIVLLDRWREQRKHFAIEQEFARLNSSASLRDSPAGAESVTLTPLTLRGSDSSPEVIPRADVASVELRLRWLRREEYPSYRAVVRRVRDGESFTAPEVRSVEGDGKTIRLRLPPLILTRGTYQIRLTGNTADGATGATEEYQFTVSG